MRFEISTTRLLRLALLFFLLGLASGARATADPVRAQGAQSNCTATPDKYSDPQEVELGELVDITLELETSCPSEVSPVDVMLVIDSSASMLDNGKISNAKAAAKAFLEAMDLSQSRVGLVAFNHVAGMHSGLTQDADSIRGKIEALSPSGQTNISAAIDLATGELVTEDRGVQRAMIVLTDGVNTVPTDPVPVAAQRAKDANIIVATICAGGECDPGLEPAATSPELYFNVPDAGELVGLYTQLAGALQANAVVELTVEDRIPDNMRYVVGSAVPAPDEVIDEPNGETVLVWRLPGAFPPDGLRYKVEPLEQGTHPTNVSAIGDFRDRKGLPGRTVFPIPSVYVPGKCPPVPLEVIFLIDDSNCLAGAVLNDMDSKEAIRRGVEMSLDRLDLGKDRAAVVAYGDTAEIFQSLTDDREAILEAVRRITMRDGSARLDLGYQKTAEELTNNHVDGAQVMTLNITDGPMMQAPDLARARAEGLRKQFQAKHYNIAVGTIAQFALLRQISEPGGFWTLPFGGDVWQYYRKFGDICAEHGYPEDCDKPPTSPTDPPPTVAPPTEDPFADHANYLPMLHQRGVGSPNP